MGRYPFRSVRFNFSRCQRVERMMSFVGGTFATCRRLDALRVRTALGQPRRGLTKQPGPGIGDRLVLVDRYDALDDADQRPQEPPSKNRDAYEYDAQRNA